MSHSFTLHQKQRESKKGAALIIVLAFVVLLTGIVVAMLMRSITDLQVSNGSAGQAKIDVFTQGAVDQIVGDLKQEIAAGGDTSLVKDQNGSTVTNLYFSMNSLVALPQTNGLNNPNYCTNLIKRSAYNIPFFQGNQYVNSSSYPAANRAANVSSISTNQVGRYFSIDRWNKHYLLPRLNSSVGNYTDSTPISNFNSPDWILVARDGSNPKTWSSSLVGSNLTQGVVGRYAYAIYDEGGLLDLNVAGYSPNMTTSDAISQTNFAYKVGLPFADLLQLPGFTNLTTARQKVIMDQLIAWRNFASIGSSNITGAALPNYTLTTGAGTNYFSSVLSNTKGFMNIGSTNIIKGQTDRMFSSRQEMIRFLTQGADPNNASSDWSYLQTAMQYLGTFSRDLNQPSYFPSPTRPTNLTTVVTSNGGIDGSNDNGNVTTSTTYGGISRIDNTLNPAFLTVRTYSTNTFTRNDGTIALGGEPLVKKRFGLNRLAWLTYLGPSAPTASGGARNTYSSSSPPSSTPSGPDYDLYLMKNNYGVDLNFLAQGTGANIYKYFGLSWVPDTRRDVFNNLMDTKSTYKWVYNHEQPNPTSGTASPIVSLSNNYTPHPIRTLSEVAAMGRDPDFVELLKAAICAGSLGKTAASGSTGTPGGVQNAYDIALDYQIIQIAANIIDQFDTDGYSTRILFNDGISRPGISTTMPIMEFRGVEDLPYLFRFRRMHFPLLDSSPSISYTPNSAIGQGVTGVTKGDAYSTSDPANQPLSASGLGVAFYAPEIWNPHMYNTNNTVMGPRPTQFRITVIDGPSTLKAPPSPVASDPNEYTAKARTRIQIPLGGSTYSSSDINMVTKPANITTMRSFSEDTSALNFTIPFNPAAVTNPASTRLDLFREPTMLYKPGIPLGSQLHFAGDGSEPVKNRVLNSASEASGGESLIQNYITVASTGYKGIKRMTKDTLNNTVNDNMNYPAGYTDDDIYLGIYLGSFPLKWADGSSGSYNVWTASTTDAVTSGEFTFRIEYKDPTNALNWDVYDEKYSGTVPYSGMNFNGFRNKQPDYIDAKLMGEGSDGQNLSYIDPRTSRFGAFCNNQAYNSGGDIMNQWSYPGPVNNAALNGANQGAMATMHQYESGTLNSCRAYNVPVAGWYPHYNNSSYTLYPALYAQNNTSITNYLGYFADPDGVVRRAMAAYVQPTANVMLISRPNSTTDPSGTPITVAWSFPGTPSTVTPATVINGEAPSRPIILNRPFRSVADLGYVFSGTSWRNLDFMTPESGSSALLDVFCMDDSNLLTAGKVNLNARQAPVLQSILSGAYKDEFSPTNAMLSASAIPTAVTASLVSSNLVARTSDMSLIYGTGSGPLGNITDLVGKWKSSVIDSASGYIDGSQSYVGFSGNKTPVNPSTPASSPPNLSSILSGDTTSSGYYAFANVARYREATIRALANAGQTRVWNLMIDVVAQTGRYPSSATKLQDFLVEGEQHYWVHIAIDRCTGTVLDKQIEVVKE